MRISLLRSPTMPDPDADQGEHRIVYSLLPHAGVWGTATIAAAYGLNDPLIVVEGVETSQVLTPDPRSLISVDRSNIVIETIKQAEDGRGIIVRLYESQRQRGPVTLTTGFDLAEVWRTNLLEENQTALTPGSRSVGLGVKPYEIVTLRLIPA
jgi:alpha-mannosidase